MNLDEIMSLIIKFIVAPLLVWLGVTIVKLLDAWVASINNEKIRKALTAARLELANAIRDSVAFVEETFVKALADPANLTRDQATKAFNLAYEKAEAIMSAASWKVLQDAGVVIKDLIQAQIEATVPVVKAEAAIIVQTLVPTVSVPSFATGGYIKTGIMPLDSEKRVE